MNPSKPAKFLGFSQEFITELKFIIFKIGFLFRINTLDNLSPKSIAISPQNASTFAENLSDESLFG
jgi:hypothetical protein